MAYEFKKQRTVEFADTDMAGILHFSNYFRYMEEIEHAFFRSLGFHVHNAADPNAWGWVRRAAECSYDAPLRYEDVVDLWLLVREKRTKSIVYQVLFQTESSSGVTVAARGSLVAVCVAKPEGTDRIRAVTMPAEVDAAVEVAPAELLAK